MSRAIRILCGLVVALCSVAANAEGPPPGEGRGPGFQLRKLGENLSKLDLTAEQQQKVRGVTEEMLTQLDEVRRNLKPGERPMAKVGEIMTDTRGRLSEILTPDQQTKLRDLMQQERSEQAKRDSEPKKVEPPVEPKPPVVIAKADPAPASKAEPKKADSKAVEPKMDSTAGTPAGVAKRPAGASQENSAPVDIGAAAPDFMLKTTTDRQQALSAYKGRVVVLIFGSYTCPVFRQRVAAIEKLNRDLNLKATFLIVYTREAHALGEWEVERNKDDNIQIEQPKTDAERRDLAKQTVATLKITIPVLVDAIDDAVARAYGLTPNGAVVIGRDGKIAARQKWFEPVALKQSIDAAAMVRNPTN